jgi:hypothetical protein
MSPSLPKKDSARWNYSVRIAVVRLPQSQVTFFPVLRWSQLRVLPEKRYEIHVNVTKILVPTAHKTHCVFVTNTNRFMLFRETIAIHSENHMKHINTIRGPKNYFPSYTIAILIQTQMV